MTASSTSSRQLLPRAERRAALLAAAAAAFVHKGFAATSMEDVAAAAGVTKLIVYRHFESKEALYEAVLEVVSARLAAEFVSRRRERNVAARTLLGVARQDPDGFVLLWRHAAREPQFAGHAERFRRLAVHVAATRLSEARLGDPVRERWAAEVLVSFLVDAVIHWLEEGDPARDHEVEGLVSDAVQAMVRAWRSAPPAPAPSRTW